MPSEARLQESAPPARPELPRVARKERRAVPPSVPRPEAQTPSHRLRLKVSTIELDSEKQPHGCYGNGRAKAESLSLSFLGPSGGGDGKEDESQDVSPPPHIPPKIGGGQRGAELGREEMRWSAAHAFASSPPPTHPLPSSHGGWARMAKYPAST